MNPAEPLTGPASLGLLATACDAWGARLRSARPVAVSVQPTGSAVVRYMATLADGTGRTVVSCTGRIPDGATVLESDGLRVGLWAWPHDPWLPGLARVDDVLRGLGREAPLRVRGYRPGRRAVLEAGDVFVKVVRPGAVPALVERHATLAPHVPVPPVLHATDDGVSSCPPCPAHRCAPHRARPGSPRWRRCSTRCPPSTARSAGISNGSATSPRSCA